MLFTEQMNQFWAASAEDAALQKRLADLRGAPLDEWIGLLMAMGREKGIPLIDYEIEAWMIASGAVYQQGEALTEDDLAIVSFAGVSSPMTAVCPAGPTCQACCTGTRRCSTCTCPRAGVMC